MSDDAVTVAVGELDRESLKGVTLWHVVLNPVLEFDCRKVAPADSLEFIICQCCRQQVTQLGVPLCVEVVLVSAQAPDFLPQDALKKFLLISVVVSSAWHEVPYA